MRNLLLLFTVAGFASCVAAADDHAEPVAKAAGRNSLLFSEQLFSPEVAESVAAGAKGLASFCRDSLKDAAVGEKGVVRIHGYAVSPEVEEVAARIFAESFPGVPQSWVISPLPHPDARIAVDWIARAREVTPKIPGVRVLPPGVRYFVSGQAAREKDLAVATRKTMEQLEGTLKQYGRSLTDAVQVKSFLRPMGDVAVARKEIESFFGEGECPPLVFVEWDSSLPIEIELVAFGGEPMEEAPPMEFLTPEGMTSSPVFCRVVRVNDAPLLFLSGINGQVSESPEAEIRGIFDRMKSLLGLHRSDLRHLAKATYYVANPEVSSALNTLRPDYYDPARPPAASKAMIAGGGGGSAVTIDMIAVAPE